MAGAVNVILTEQAALKGLSRWAGTLRLNEFGTFDTGRTQPEPPRSCA